MKLTYTDQRANAIFSKRYRGAGNFMTPRNLGRKMVHGGRLAVELSEGESIFPDESGRRPAIYGVTVLDAADVRSDLDLNQCLHSRSEAIAYIEAIDRDGTAARFEEAA